MALLKQKPKSKKETSEAADANSTVMIAHSSSASQHNLRNIRLIVGREYLNRVRKKSFVIATAVVMVLIIVGSFVPTVIELITAGSQTKLTIVNSAGTVAGGQDPVSFFNTRLNVSFDATTGQPKPVPAGKKPDYEIKTEEAAKLDSLRQLVRDGKLDNLLVISRNAKQELSYELYTSGSTLGTASVRLRSIANELNTLDALGRSGVAPAQIASIFSTPQFKATSARDEKTGRSQSDSLAAYLIALAGITLLFTTLLQYGVAVAQGAAEEKSNRVMEIMINAATPFQLMLGKIIGIGLASGTQMIALALASGIAFISQGPVRSVLLGSSASSDIPSTNGLTFEVGGISVWLVGLVVVFYLLGYLLYATIFAAVGSLISRVEEVQNAIAPMSFLFIVVFYSGIFGLQTPDAVWVTVLSYIPFFTPILMLVRAAMDTVQWWEILISLGLLVITIVFMTFVASRVYRAGVLMYGQKASFGKLLKLAFSK